MFERDFGPFVPPHFAVRSAADAWETSAARALRRRVFCDEQQIFARNDADAVDEIATTIVAVEEMMGMPHRVVGTVRIAPARTGVWYGPRLAIERDYRKVYGLGTGLIHRAVGTALARGCTTFLAHVQRENVPLFQRISWEALREVDLYGRPHVLMRAQLAAYAACAEGTNADLIRSRRRAS